MAGFNSQPGSGLVPGSFVPGSETPGDAGLTTKERTAPFVMAVAASPSRVAPFAMAITSAPAKTLAWVMALTGSAERTVDWAMATEIIHMAEVPFVMATDTPFVRVAPFTMAVVGYPRRFIPFTMAVSKTLSPAQRAPRRPTQMPYILAAFPPSLYDHNPEATPVLALQVGTGWRVDGDLLEVTGGAVPFACDLRDYTLSQLAAALTQAGYTAVAQTAWATVSATVLLDGLGRLEDDRRLYAFTTVLHRLLRSIVLVWDRLADDLDHGMQQLDLRQAEDEWLDWWGALYGVPRGAAEGDEHYRRRILYSTLKPRTNNVAIRDAILQILDLDVTVTDDSPVGVARSTTDGAALNRTYSTGRTPHGRMWPGYPPAFTVTIPIEANDAELAAVTALVERFRAAGTRATVRRG